MQREPKVRHNPSKDNEGKVGAKHSDAVVTHPTRKCIINKNSKATEKEDFSWVAECLIIKPCILHPRPKFERPKIKYPKFGRFKSVVSGILSSWHGVWC